MRRSGLRAAFCALAATIAVGLAPARAQPPMWIVRSPQATLVLFGSVHLLPAGLDWRPPASDYPLYTTPPTFPELVKGLPFFSSLSIPASSFPRQGEEAFDRLNIGAVQKELARQGARFR